jgi:hypothetical protein
LEHLAPLAPQGVGGAFFSGRCRGADSECDCLVGTAALVLLVGAVALVCLLRRRDRAAQRVRGPRALGASGLLASLVPALHASRVTVREALTRT